MRVDKSRGNLQDCSNANGGAWTLRRLLTNQPLPRKDGGCDEVYRNRLLLPLAKRILSECSPLSNSWEIARAERLPFWLIGTAAGGVVPAFDAPLCDRSTRVLDMVGSSKTLIRYFEEDFSPEILKGATDNTRKQYRNAVRKFTQWSGCDIQIHLVTETLVERFGRAIVAEGMSVQNARKYEVYVRRVARQRYPDRCLKKMGRRPHEWKSTEITGLSDEDMMVPGGLLKFYHDEYVPRRMITASPMGIQNHRHNIRRFARYLGRVPMLADLQDDVITAFMGWIIASGLSVASANCSRASLLALWRYAVKRGLLIDGPKDVEKLRERKSLPEAWTMEEMGKIIESARGQHRPKSGLPCPPGMWFEAFILTAYDTALRLRALLGIRLSGWNPGRREITVDADFQKHGVAQTFVVSQETADAIGRMLENWSSLKSDTVFLFTWPARREALFDAYRSILRRASLYRGPKDSVHKLRRTAATHLTAVIGIEAASRQLGHSSVEMTRRYVDLRLTGHHNAAENLPRPIKPDQRRNC